MDTMVVNEDFAFLFLEWAMETEECAQIHWHRLPTFKPLMEFVCKHRDQSVRLLFEGYRIGDDGQTSIFFTLPKQASFVLYKIGFSNLPVLHRYDREKPKNICRLFEWAIAHGHNTWNVRFEFFILRAYAREIRLAHEAERRTYAEQRKKYDEQWKTIPKGYSLNAEMYRFILHKLHDNSVFCSLSWMWRKMFLYKLLRVWGLHNKGACLQILLEEMEECGWVALDLIDQLIDRKRYIIWETSHYPNRYDAKKLLLYRFAMGHGYGTQKVRVAYDALRNRLEFERKMQKIVKKLDHRRVSKSITDQDWKRAKASFERIAQNDPKRFFTTALHEYLLWRGYNTKNPDAQLVQLLSDIMTTIEKPPRRLATAKTPADIYHAWFQGDPKDEPSSPEQKTATPAALEN